MLAVPPRERHLYNVKTTLSLRKFETHCMLFVLTPLMFAYHCGVFRNGGQAFTRLLYVTAITELTMLLFVSFMCAADFGVPD